MFECKIGSVGWRWNAQVTIPVQIENQLLLQKFLVSLRKRFHRPPFLPRIIAKPIQN